MSHPGLNSAAVEGMVDFDRKRPTDELRDDLEETKLRSSFVSALKKSQIFREQFFVPLRLITESNRI